MRRIARAFFLVVVSLPIASGVAHACTIDGKPSAYANGARAVLYTKPPTAATYAWWARFAFATTFHRGQHIAFREDDAQVRPLLKLADLSRPWRWDFGDKSARLGDRVTHSYRATGRFKVAVEAYFQGYGWEPFDTITITVR